MWLRTSTCQYKEFATWTFPPFFSINHTIRSLGWDLKMFWSSPLFCQSPRPHQWASLLSDPSRTLHLGSNIELRFENCSFVSSILKQCSPLPCLPTVWASFYCLSIYQLSELNSTVERFYRTELIVCRLWNQTVLSLALNLGTYGMCLVASHLTSLSVEFCHL